VLGLAILLRERVVGHFADEVLQEPVLATLGRAGVSLQRDDLLAHQRGQDRFDVFLRKTGHLCDPLFEERLAEDRPVLDDTSLLRGKSI